MASQTPIRRVYKVAELVRTLGDLIEQSLPAVWIEGELSGFKAYPSGHWYFTLKDADAQLRCVMFKSRNTLIKPLPKDGDLVLLRGKVGVYQARGELQLVAEHLEPAGEGALLRAFEQLKAKLAADGLFDEKLKRPIPEVPKGIGIITSPKAAALQDVLTTLKRRFPLGTAHFYPVPVQGDGAAPAVVRALEELPRLAPVDVILLVRGGGSLEDLWCFNDERIARAIRACKVPVVTGIGHEIDFTIADFAADLRAPTPTGAAERVSPDVSEWRENVERLAEHLADALQVRIANAQSVLSHREARLTLAHPGRRLQQFTQRLDEFGERLAHWGPAMLKHRVMDLARLGQLLQSLGPRAILERGYAIVQTADGTVLRDAAAATAGAELAITLARGTLGATVSPRAKRGES